MKKIISFLMRIWRDPVWSSVIAATFVILGTAIFAFIKNLSVIDLYNMFLQLLNVKIPLFVILSILGALFLIRFLLRFFKTKSNSVWKEKIGDYTFDELYRILQNQNLPVQTRGMEWSKKDAPQEDLLTLFRLYKVYINKGVTSDLPLDDGGYLYGVLCPKLISYGIVEKIDYKDSRTGLDQVKYQTTELGNKFYRLIEKVVYITKK